MSEENKDKAPAPAPAAKKAKSPEEIELEKKAKARVADISKVKKDKKKGEKTIEVTKSLAGRFFLSHTVGEFVNIEAKQADEICEDGFGKEV